MYKLLYPTGYASDPEQMRNTAVMLHKSDAGKWLEIIDDDDNTITLFIDEIDLLIEHLHAVKKVLNGN